MAHGLRRRVVAIGAGVVLCTGLVGCMNDDKKPISPPPTAKRSGQMMPGPGSTNPVSQTGGSGAQFGGAPRNGFTPAADPNNSALNNLNNAGPNSNNFGGISGPAAPGVRGAGGAIPGAGNSYAPSVTPPGGTSNYMPPPAAPGNGGMPSPNMESSHAIPPTLGNGVPTGSMAIAPTTPTAVRATAPSYRNPDPEPVSLSQLGPVPPAPPAGSGGAYPAAPSAPAVAMPSLPSPTPPAAPQAPIAP